MKFSVLTLGCKVNQYESEFIINSLIDKGYCFVNLNENPDIVIINSCSVTEEAKRQSLQYVRKAKRLKNLPKVILTGCVVDDIKECKFADKCISNFYKKEFARLIDENGDFFYENIFNEDKFIHLPVKRFYNTTRGFLKIQDGCKSYCSYCRIIYLRGKPRSMFEKDVINSIVEIKEKQNIKEIVLCGINISLYGVDFGLKNGLYKLLKKIDDLLRKKEIKNLRLRLSSLRPEVINKDFVKLINESEYFCPHLHLSIQNLNDDVLKLMNRNYRFIDICKVLEIIKKENEFINIGADLITGFPNETYERFKDNVKKLEEIDINYIHVFPFSKKKGTKAYEFNENISKEEKKERVKILRAIGEEKKRNFLEKNLNLIHRILIEEFKDNYWMGFSDNYIKFKIKVDLNQLKNKFINAIAKRIENNLIMGGEIYGN